MGSGTAVRWQPSAGPRLLRRHADRPKHTASPTLPAVAARGTIALMAHPSPARVYLVLGLAVLAVSLAAIFIRLADAPGLVVAAIRMLLASVVVLPWTIRGLRRTPPTRDNIGYAVLAGVFLAGHFATWITSLTYTTVAASVTLVTTIPLWVALLGWFFLGRAPSLTVLLGVLIAVAGGATIGFGDFGGGSAPLLGDALALTGALCSSAYLLLGRSAQRRGLGLDAYVGVAYGVAALLLLPLPALFGMTFGGYTAATYGWIVLLALIPQLVGHTGLNFAIKHLDPTLVATAVLLEPVGSTVLALLLFREIPGALTLFGAGVLLAGVALTIRFTQETLVPIRTGDAPDRG